MPGRDDVPSVRANYAADDLAAKIIASLRAAGKDPVTLTPDDLAPVDQFHTGGVKATRQLMERAGLRPEMRVLDVGGGLGGPARTLATTVGCHVTVLDLMEEYCRVGEMLTARTGLSDRVIFWQGDALAMPFADETFDAVWTQHSSMNIANKEALYAEIYRVLRPGGRLALHEIMAGPVQPIHFPVMWAHDATASFLHPPEAVRAILGATGFVERSWADMTAPALVWFQTARPAPPAGDTPPIGLNLLLSDFGTRVRNVRRNLAEHRITLIQGVFERP